MIKYSATKIDTMNYCIMRFYLKYLEHAKELELPAFKKGSTLHDLTEHFWNRLGDKYNCPESFGKYGKGKFFQRVIMFENSGKRVDWSNKNQKYEIAESINKISRSLFNILLNEGPPLYTELPFEFIAFERKFTGKIDEVRIKDEKIVIRDYKSGKPWMGHMKLNHDPQMTIYNVGLSSMCYYDEKFANSLGILNERKKFMGVSSYINEKIQHEFFIMEAPLIIENSKENKKIKSIPNIINLTTRKDEHFYEVIKMIKGGEKHLSEGNVYPERGRKCDDCSMKFSCEKELMHAKKDFPENKDGQSFFNFAAPFYKKPLVEKTKHPRLFKEIKKYKSTNLENL